MRLPVVIHGRWQVRNGHLVACDSGRLCSPVYDLVGMAMGVVTLTRPPSLLTILKAAY